MRKFKIITVVALVAVMSVGIFNACEKDGVYKPKKKIVIILNQYGIGEEKLLSERWIWNNNKLSKIEYENGYYEVFEYKKNQISKIIGRNGDYQNFTYNGSKISEIEYFFNNTLWLMEFEYSGDKISKIIIEKDGDFEYNEDYDYVSKSLINEKSNVLRLILPEQILQNITKISLKNQKNKKKSIEKITKTCKFTWKENNIEQIIIEQSDNGKILYTETIKYTYDDKINPMYGLLSEEISSLSKNNVTKMTSTNSNNYTYEYNYTYVYKDNFPTEMTSTSIFDSYKYIVTTYYEYK